MKRLLHIYEREPVRIVLGISLFVAALVTDGLVGDNAALPIYLLALIASGALVFIDAVRGILRLDFLDEKFLMSIASVGAMIIGERAEGVAVMLFYLVGEYFEHRAVRRSRASIKSLMDIRPDTARVLLDGVEYERDAEDVSVGSIIVIRPGERCPIDAVVIEGRAELDTSALTGESLPRTAEAGSEIQSGTVVLDGVLTARTVRLAEESAAARVLELVENAQEHKSREESFITSFSRVYTPIVTVLALLMAILPSAFGWLRPADAVYRALSFLVVSCPCALVISVPMAFFGGIGGAASTGILYKGGNVFSPISRLKAVVFDKTGTLTEAELRVDGIYPEGISEGELSRLTASLEQGSNHPLASALSRLDPSAPPARDIRELSGRGVTGTVGEDSVGVGNAALMRELGVNIPDGPTDGVLVAKNGVYVGRISLTDNIKSEAGEALTALRALGVTRTVILSGDSEGSVRGVAEALGVNEHHSSLLPEDKYRHLEKIISETDGTVAFVGDGINDSPCLARADVGIAMGEIGSDSAIEAADAVIMTDRLTALVRAVKIARRTLAIAKENIVFAIGIKLLVIVLAAFNLVGMWAAVFADVGVAVLAILNSMRALRAPSN